MNILVIEDDELLGEVTSALLLTQGHISTIARTVEQAASLLIAPNDFGAVLLDLSVGKDRGDHLIRRLRNDGHKLPPVIIFSGESTADLHRSAEAISAAAILQKPCKGIDLASAIDGTRSTEQTG